MKIDAERGRRRLTDKQAEIMNFIASSILERSFPPSIREIGEAVGLSSSSSVHNHLCFLERHKYIRRAKNKPRSIEVVDWDKAQREQVMLHLRVRRPLEDQLQETDHTLSLSSDLVDDPQSFVLEVDRDYPQLFIRRGDWLVLAPGGTPKAGYVSLLRRQHTLHLAVWEDSLAEEGFLGRMILLVRHP